jgi:hypothetical protein
MPITLDRLYLSGAFRMSFLAACSKRVIPAKAGTQNALDARSCGHDTLCFDLDGARTG